MEKIEGVQNIVFDLGGVIIDLNRDAAVSALEQLGIADADSLLGLYRQEGPFLRIEVGEISAARFFDILRAQCRPDTADTEIEEAFNKFLVRLPVERLEMLRNLRKRGKKLYVLSNTNAVMFNSWICRAFQAQGLRMEDYFDGIVASFREGICKPDPEVFKVVLRRFGLRPEQTIMLDDSETNCQAARSVGMRAMKIDLPGSDNDVIAVTDRII